MPVKIWTGLVEHEALAQLANTANLPFVFKHVAAMPDVHFGRGATVGSVIATKGAVCPAAVGVDIGCGMCAVKTGLPADLVRDQLPQLRRAIECAVPVGRDGNKRILPSVEEWSGWSQWSQLHAVDKDLREKALSQLGSLGGGNHFIEVCLDESDAVWVMLHSGSRNVGKTIAERHINRAKGWVQRLAVSLPDPDLSWFAEGTHDFENYLRDLHWAQDYALQNRVEMMNRVLYVLSQVLLKGKSVPKGLSVNCHHNYVSRETHFGEKVLVTRKGAVSAREGEHGIIPGSMGARSYIVRGLGNPESFHSCSHGAGRRMSRGEAKRRFNLRDLEAQTREVQCAQRSMHTKDDQEVPTCESRPSWSLHANRIGSSTLHTFQPEGLYATPKVAAAAEKLNVFDL